ncbi:LCP family protein [Candidatus Uhrbacteria bacterium]|nr:LCP family protein [Candidatus Uhrbacteria bacterium]
MNRRIFLFGTPLILFVLLVLWFVTHASTSPTNAFQQEQALQQEIQAIIDTRLAMLTSPKYGPFKETDDVISILLIGLDTRAGSDVAHCDVIQFIEINNTNQTVRITAVPRGTYSPLPGTGHIPSDYYVSNACGIGGLEYGLAQIEKILNKQPDHIVMIGFSEAIGSFRLLGLPATETLQWLRVRQPYAIGEPQRAHNHSTFLKHLLTNTPLTETSHWQTALEYVLYNLVDTDLTFTQAQELVSMLASLQLQDSPERVELFMKPEYTIQEIPYNADQLDVVLQTPFNPADGPSDEETQQRVIDAVSAGLTDTSFVTRAFDQHLWLQLNDRATRESIHFTLLSAILEQTQDEETRQTILADYVIEMEALGESSWAEQGRSLLVQNN